jgi:hypothetical protein
VRHEHAAVVCVCVCVCVCVLGVDLGVLSHSAVALLCSMQSGCYFLDRDGRHFHDILNYLRVLILLPV